MSRLPRDVSVVICTHAEDRWGDLREAVESVRRQSLAPLETVLVVDHNSRLCSLIRLQVPDVTVIENTGQRGLSAARNAGIAAAHGAYVAFLDDDAAAAPDWLERLRTGCDQPNVLGVGGASIPRWRGERPAWFPEEFLWVVGCTYLGLPRTTTPVRNTFGGCSCIRRAVFDVVGGYRSDVGRVGESLMSCDETEFSIRVSRHYRNGIFLYDPTAVIHHNVPPNRTTWAYFRSRCFFEGRSKAIVTHFTGVNEGLSSERTYIVRTLPLGVLRGIADTLARGDVSGLARAGAIIAGLAITSAGYMVDARGQVSGGVSQSPWRARSDSRGTALPSMENTHALVSAQRETGRGQRDD